MKLLHIVTLHYQYDDNYIVDITLHSGIFEVWLSRKDIGIKELLFGVDAVKINIEEVANRAEQYIRDNDCIDFYESEYCEP